MATLTITTSGITSPSATTQGFWGSGNTKPPTSGGNFLNGNTEFTTAQYTAASAADGSFVSPSFSSDTYSGIKCEFFVPSANRTITQIDFGMKGIGNDGYTDAYGWTLYIRNNATPAWESIASTSSSANTSLTGTKTTSLSNYVDSNFRIQIMMMNNGFDSNGSFPVSQLDYAYATITYTPSAVTFTPWITWIN